jgi:hypothetical protein
MNARVLIRMVFLAKCSVRSFYLPVRSLFVYSEKLDWSKLSCIGEGGIVNTHFIEIFGACSELKHEQQHQQS